MRLMTYLPRPTSYHSTAYCEYIDAYLLTIIISETIRKKLQLALGKQNKIKYGEERFSMWWIEFIHPAMWHVALG